MNVLDDFASSLSRLCLAEISKGEQERAELAKADAEGQEDHAKQQGNQTQDQGHPYLKGT